ncbi:MAG: MFS transporter [Thermoplasmata archaeon]
MVSALALLIANRATRTFGYGFTAVVLAIYLTLLGGSEAVVIATLSISLLSGAVLNVLVSHYGDRFGRRKAMVAFGLLMAAAGGILTVAPNFPIALVALFLGAASPTGTEVSPFLSIEQSIVAEVARQGHRTRAFAVYNLLGSLGASAGALAAVPFMVRLGTNPASPDPLRPLFLLYAAIGLASALISVALPATVELENRSNRVRLSAQSRSRLAKIAALFSVDSLAGGFVLQGFVSLWFFTKYPESVAYLGFIFAAAGVLSALSFLVAARLGERIGLLETMVVTHLPSNLLLIAVPLAPSFLLALAAYLARMALSQMDVPTRQAYLAGIVAREERTAANALTNVARNTTQAIGPVAAGAVIAAFGSSAPFFIGGGLKIAYDLAIFRAFRTIRPEET